MTEVPIIETSPLIWSVRLMVFLTAGPIVYTEVLIYSRGLFRILSNICDETIWENSCFSKMLHHRYVTGFWICLSITVFSVEKEIQYGSNPVRKILGIYLLTYFMPMQLYFSAI